MAEYSLQVLKQEIKKHADPTRARVSQGFFKTGKGQYAEGDIFLGLTVPECRTLARTYSTLPLASVRQLLRSPIHEERLIALLLLVTQFQKGTPAIRGRIYRTYITMTRFINNWDLVDLSADKIVGAWLEEKNTAFLKKLARSQNLWERRIAILSTFHFIKQGHFTTTFHIIELIMRDPHDLIHKAAGWMLREIGKRSRESEEIFLQKYYLRMPRTMLRYAIEHFPETERRAYLLGKVV